MLIKDVPCRAFLDLLTGLGCPQTKMATLISKNACLITFVCFTWVEIDVFELGPLVLSSVFLTELAGVLHTAS